MMLDTVSLHRGRLSTEVDHSFNLLELMERERPFKSHLIPQRRRAIALIRHPCLCPPARTSRLNPIRKFAVATTGQSCAHNSDVDRGK